MKNYIRLISFALYALTGCQSAQKLPLAIEATELQVLYYGLQNPITYVHHGIDCDDIIITCEKGRAIIEKNDKCEFSITLNGAWKEGLTLYIYNKTVSEKTLLETRHLRVEPLPRPTASLNGNTGPEISTGALWAVKVVSTTLSGFVFDGFRFKVTEFDYFVVDAESKEVIIKGHNKGPQIPSELRQTFMTLKTGDFIHIYNIETTSNNGIVTLAENNISIWLSKN